MNRDPFYREIIKRLDGKLDHDIFESCAPDLLRRVYPTLVPIRGGDDAGMDGAIADAEGEPFPLVTTTQKDVIGNLTRNLKSYLRRGGTRRKVVLATSRYLTQRRRENLFSRASQLGFLLISIHDQDAMADLLYRSPEWCIELLNLTGDPSPLSAVPRTTRPQLANVLTGRDEALAWLFNMANDGLLVGQPGSGKTSLLRSLVGEGRALFVSSQDRGEIAAAIRQYEEKITLIVDDAHLYFDVIPELVQIRAETGADLSILASCWPTARDRIAEKLNLIETQIHRLELLSQDEMVAVIKSVGLGGPDHLIRELVNQAQGRPGLAITMTLLCLLGGVQELISGESIHRSLIGILEDLAMRQEARLILASFSIGGDAGMLMNDVATLLGLGYAEVWAVVTELNDSGIVYDAGQECVSVQPAALRQALVRNVFFQGPRPLPIIDQLLAKVPSMAETGFTLIGAKARGGMVPDRLLVDVLEKTDSARGWQEYAWLGRNEANWVLTNHPERLITVARPALHNIPKAAIPALLERAIGDNRKLHSSPNHLLRILGDWIKAAPPNSGQAIARRNTLLNSVCDWLEEPKDVSVGLRALEFTMFPGFGFTSTDPGSGMTATMRCGLLTLDEIIAIEGLWDRISASLESIIVDQWEPIRRIVENWVYPSRSTFGHAVIREEIYQRMRVFASRMLADVVSLASGRLGVMRWALNLADNLGTEIDIPLDDDYEVLYPKEDLEDWSTAQKQQAAHVRALAAEWCKVDPETVVERLAFIEAEAQQADSTWPRLSPYLCTQIANNIESASPWLQAFMNADVTSDLAAPFLAKAALSNEKNWETFAHAYFTSQSYRLATITVILTLEDPPPALTKRVFEVLGEYYQTVEFLSMRDQIPAPSLKQLLQHENGIVASAAARGEWSCEPRGKIRDSLSKEWQRAVLNHAKEGYWLEQVFHSDPCLAQKWLESNLADSDFSYFRYDRSINAAIDSLNTEARKQTIDHVSSTDHPSELMAHIVGNDSELYETLLKTERLKDLHLAPLMGEPDNEWIARAQLAMDSDYGSQEIAQAVYGPSVGWTGNESDMWGAWVKKFEALCSHEDERIEEIGTIGRDYARSRQVEALERERSEAVFGRW